MSASGIFVVAIALWFVGGAVYGVVKALRTPGAKPWLVLPGGLLLIYGGGTFFFQGAGSRGALAFVPATVEFPVWRPETSVRTTSDLTVVGLVPSSRVQVYDADGQFRTGWFVPTGGRPFQLLPSPNRIKVVGRGVEAIYDERGRPVHDAVGSPAATDMQIGGRPPANVEWGPLWWPLSWPMSSPFAAWFVGALGALALYVGAPAALGQLRRPRSRW
jgi:hypothetical protein